MSQDKKFRMSPHIVYGPQRQIPEFMRADAGKGTENIPTTECAWMGKYLELEDTSLQGFVTEVRSLDQAVAIARSDGLAMHRCPAADRSATKLSMDWEARKRGPKTLIDDYLVCKISARYHNKYFKIWWKYPELDSIIRVVIRGYRSKERTEHHSNDALLARLRRKFNAQKDGLLCAVGAEDLPERGPGLAGARRELDDLEDGGVSIDRSRLDPALSRKSKRS